MQSSRKQRPTVVLDTNVWISALVWGGNPAELVKAAEKREIEVLISVEIIGEITETLSYPKLEKIYGETGKRRRDLIEAVLRIAKIVEVKTHVDAVHADPSDDKFIECALAGGARYIVSGDRHLLKLRKHKDVQIISVNDFSAIFNK